MSEEMIESFDSQLRDYLEHGAVEAGVVETLVESSLAELAAVPTATSGAGASFAKAWWLGGGLAAAAAAALALTLAPTGDQGTQVSSVDAPLPAMEMVLVAGQVWVGDESAGLGPLEAQSLVSTGAGEACMAMRERGSFCARAQSKVELDAQGRPLLRSGTLLAALDADFELPVADSLLRGNGAQLALTRLDTGYRVEVDGAPVDLRHGQTSWTVQPGQWLEWSGESLLDRGALRRDESSAMLALLGLEELWGAPLLGRTRISVGEGAEAAELRLDGRPIGVVPVRAYLPAGVHHLELVAAGYESHQGDFEIRAGEEHVIDAELRERDDAEDALEAELLEDIAALSEESAGDDYEETLPAEDLLALARTAMKDKRWGDAAFAYRRLRRAYPGGALAHAALVSIGNLELEHLGRPARARRAYRAYLRKSGPLAQEAQWGLVRASKGSSGERSAIEGYLSRYPSSPEATGLRERLADL
jgi:hypothetical protein